MSSLLPLNINKGTGDPIMQTKSYHDMMQLQTPTLLVHGTLDIFVIKKNLKKVAARNKKYIVFKSAIGPHEITPLHGKAIAELLHEKS